eukprot:290942_1
MDHGSKSQNAADYLLETEYLSTTLKLNEHWLSYRQSMYPNFISKINESLNKNLSFEHLICDFDINNFIGCDVGEWAISFKYSSTYIHAFWSFIGLFLRTTRYYFRKWPIVIFNVLISIAAALILGSIYGSMTEKQ